MNILITGATGFLGSWFCRILAKNHEVTALVRPESDLYRINNIRNLRVEVAPEESWTTFIRNHESEVFIFNDWWGVGNQFRNDDKQFENIERFKKLLAAAIKPSTKIIVGVGSQAELGPVSGTILESQSDNPTTKYGQAKVEARRLLLDINENPNIRTVWLRIFSTYGPLDSSGWLIADTISNLIGNKEMQLTAGEQEWSYLHSYDLALALNVILENEEISGIVNAGNPYTDKISKVVTSIAAILAKPNLIQLGALPYRDDQVMQLKPACEKLTQSGWKPKVELFDGLSHLIDWYKGKNSNLFLNDGTSVSFELPKISK